MLGAGVLTVVTLTAVALVAGVVSSVGAVGSASGLLLLLGSVVGAGLALPDPWWKARR